MTAPFALLLCLCLQADNVSELTADESAAVETITEKRVVSTVSFLASDEMAGRNTPSPELNIAAAYVASRLQAAGLEGLGPDGSFYQETTVNTAQTPAATIRFSGDTEVRSLGLLLGGKEAVEFSGKVVKAGSSETYTGAVWTEVADTRGGPRRAVAMLSRAAAEAARAGAKAMLVVVKPDSPIVGAAASRRARATMVSSRSPGSPIPVLLVSAAPTGTIELSAPAQINGTAIVRNVIGVRRGSDPAHAKKAIIFSAHLDHIGRANGPDPVNNGADDDASGVTAVLSLADAYGSMKTAPKRSTIFMTFWGEEWGMLGSRHYAENPLWPLKDVVANINIEMVGRPEKGAEKTSWMTGWDQSDLGTLMAAGSKRIGMKIFEHPRFSQMLYGSSDNISFVRVGVIAHSFSAGSLHEDYHQPGDEWHKLQIPHMTSVIRGLFAGSLPIAQGQVTPKAAKAE